MAQIEGIDSFAMVAGRGSQVQCVVDQAASPGFCSSLLQNRFVLRGAKRNDVEVRQDILFQQSPDLKGMDSRCKRGPGENSVKFGGAMCTDYRF